MSGQLATAALGIIPRDTLALGVEVDRTEVSIVCQLRFLTDQAHEDLRDITSNLVALLGNDVEITLQLIVRSEPKISPNDGIWWIYAARTDGN